MSYFQIAFRPELTSPRLCEEKTNAIVVLYISGSSLCCPSVLTPLTHAIKIDFACINSLQHDFIGFETEDAGGQDETAVSA